ncbi:uncharacterized protein ACA1_301410 [Acanthamoeba castellanii str. Neff]|uniref:Uncharacterized protein n=1 Tax=Acanthamoeba castellanii (strain ATCC 30010 / Neff) TaxID=1257118 RepID=L8GJZ8_ACACF|nr:uncharacterized protein ACA1_301410 [Acanthamoeba castellanii str. Neff]ELR13139.1 hypothetical protein ACA1_301410 [Acanthamoeba castellanii str. Neff]
MFELMEAIGLCGSHMESLINSQCCTEEDVQEIHHYANKYGSVSYTRGYELTLMFCLAMFFIGAITEDKLVTEPSINTPLKDKKCYLASLCQQV